MFCPNCGYNYDKGSTCPICGYVTESPETVGTKPTSGYFWKNTLKIIIMAISWILVISMLISTLIEFAVKQVAVGFILLAFALFFAIPIILIKTKHPIQRKVKKEFNEMQKVGNFAGQQTPYAQQQMPYTAQTATPTRVQAHPVPNKPPISNAELLLLKIDSLSTSGIYFEKVACELLKANGFENVRMTQTTNDYGIDVLAEKGGISFAVQCKCYSSTVGNKAVQEALAGKQMYKCMIAVVFTNSTFSKNATELAKTAQVLLWDRTKLVEMINALSDECLQWLINGD